MDSLGSMLRVGRLRCCRSSICFADTASRLSWVGIRRLHFFPSSGGFNSHYNSGFVLPSVDSSTTHNNLFAAWVAFAGAGAAAGLQQKKSKDGSCFAVQCAGSDDGNRLLYPGIGLVALGLVALGLHSRRNLKIADDTGSQAAYDGPVYVKNDETDVLLDELAAFFYPRCNPRHMYETLVNASGSTRRKGIDIQNLPPMDDNARKFLTEVDRDGIGFITLPQFMVLSVLPGLMCPVKGAWLPDMSKIVFSLFCSVDENTDAEISETEWHSLHEVMHLFGLLPSLAKCDMPKGELDLRTFRACCRKHLDQTRLLRRYTAAKK